MGNTHSGEQWYHRNLPHYDGQNQYQMITYRLADSLAQAHLRRLEGESQGIFRQRIEERLDKSYGSCLLQRNIFADLVVSSWKFWDGQRYDLISYVVMPNHVHLLIRVYEGESLSRILHSWRSWTSSEIHKKQKQLGEEVFIPLWQREYWDRYIRDENHFKSAVDYIHQNPVKAGLVKCMEEWQWSSVREFNSG